MDRLFLQGLAAELRVAVVGRRVRSAVVDRELGLVSLSLGPGSALHWSYVPDVAGPFLGSPLRAGATTPGLRTRVAAASVRSLDCAELDRVVTLGLEQTRLSGRRARSALVMEVISNRVALYLVDEESATIVEAFAISPPRRSPGERYEAPPPPPSAGRLAVDAAEFELRLGQALARGAPRRAAFLAASGASPLVVREMEWLVDEEGRSAPEAFERLRVKLASKSALLYRSGDESPGCRLSPLPLASEPSMTPRVYESFSEALRDGFEERQRLRRIRALRSKLGAALAKRLSRARKLRSRLHDDLGSLEEPSVLRLRGETLLAGMSRGRRSADGSVVVLPDSFDSEEREIEIEVDPRLPLAANAERFFSRARKSERAGEELRRRIDSLETDLDYWETLECDLRDAEGVEDLEALEQEALEQGLVEPAAEKKKKKSGVPARSAVEPRRYLSRSGNVILVGRSGRSNDETTFRIAQPDDLWFHAAGIPGAHVVLRLEPGAAPLEGDLEDAAAAAAYFSKGREDTRVDVIVTERRNVSKIRGRPPGLVKVQNVRTLRVAPRKPEET